MKIEHEFTVGRAPDRVWEFFQDIPSVAQCLPGAELLGKSDDGSYDGKLSVKLGPMAASFEGKATVTPDPGSKSAVIEGKGVDRSGGSRGQVKVSYQIAPRRHRVEGRDRCRRDAFRACCPVRPHRSHQRDVEAPDR